MCPIMVMINDDASGGDKISTHEERSECELLVSDTFNVRAGDIIDRCALGRFFQGCKACIPNTNFISDDDDIEFWINFSLRSGLNQR